MPRYGRILLKLSGEVLAGEAAFGIDPDTIVYNHLKQPRELVKAKAVTSLFA